MIVTLFNDLGDSDGEGRSEPGTYLVALKKIDENLRCIPVNFSRLEKAAITEFIDCEGEVQGKISVE
jgi:hypothetical protein